MKKHFYFSYRNIALFIWRKLCLHGLKGGYILCGESGTGKSVLLNGMQEEFVKRKSVVKKIETEELIEGMLTGIRTGDEHWFDKLFNEETDIFFIENLEDLRYKDYTWQTIEESMLQFLKKNNKLIVCTFTGRLDRKTSLKCLSVNSTRVTSRIIKKEAAARSITLSDNQVQELKSASLCSLQGKLNSCVIQNLLGA